MKLSVIIPTHNRPGILRDALSALERQTLAGDRFEVIVVDDGSTEENRTQVRGLGPALRYTLVEKEQGGLASARNRGAARAGGDVLHFLDDDVLAHPELLERHLTVHESHAEPVAVLGALPYPPRLRLTPFLWYLERSGHYDLYRNPKKYAGGRPPMPPLNGNSSIRRETFERIGRYDEGFRQYGSEDLDLGYRLARAGIRFVYEPRAIGYHDHVKGFPQFCRDMEAAGESLIELYRRYPEIRVPKKIDVLEQPLRRLPGRKKLVKLVLALSLAAPWALAVPRAAIRAFGSVFALRHLLFPLYRWVGHYHYAVGMRRGLAAGR